MEAEPAVELDVLSVREVLDADSRPAFVIDLDPDEKSSAGENALLPVFCNAALRLHERLADALVGAEAEGISSNEGDPTYEKFRNWATGVTPHDDSKDVFPLSFLYGDLLWTGSTVRRRWRIISGNRTWRDVGPLHDLSSGVPPEVATGGVLAKDRFHQSTGTTQKPPEAILEQSVVTGSATLVSSKPLKPQKPFFYPSTGGSSDERSSSQSTSITLSAPDRAVSDWTAAEPKGVLSAHLQHARSIDWAQTPLGPMESWSPEFRQAANLCMGNPHPAALFWGNELTVLYNEAYANEVAGNKHPEMMGTGYSGMFSEIWDYAGPIFAECARTGMSVRKENDYLPIYRHGLLEETFYSWSFTPLYGGTKRILGFYNAPFETTSQVINQRRMTTINKLGEHTGLAKTVKQFWKFILEGIEDNHFDVPFALLYSVGDDENGDHSSMSSESSISLKTCHLEGSIGVPEHHIAAPFQLDLKRSREGFVPSFREAMRTREPTLLHTRDGTLPEALLEGIEWRGFGDPCRQATIFPVRPTNGDNVLAFLVLGINPRRHYDDEYKAFINMLNRQLATSLASVLLYEEEVRRNQDAAEAAALEKEHLTQQLDLQASRLRRMTELSPLGMFLISPEGVLREANDRFYEMTGHTRDSQYEMSWMDFIAENSITIMEDGWHRLVDEHLPWSGELQLKKRPTSTADLQGEAMDYWIMFSAHSEFAVAGGALRSIMGSITDISHLKWAQGLQNRRLQEAEETRRQQNEFIDITSHEMRNPLSAILQCADDISSELASYHNAPPPSDVVRSCESAARTITLCVQHQKSIVDDILAISKLDSNLLVITPTIAQPEAILRRAVRMFDPELQAKGIQLEFEVHQSYTELAIDWVAIDPSRVLQILINLMTNAIKFTASVAKPKITVHVGASLAPPDGRDIPGFQYVPSNTLHSNIATSEEWMTGETVYVRFKVQDTGCGLTPEEKQILFQRFKQASPRTHAQYGGSGLGLFISRRLTELHGGQIGVASVAGLGSLFEFYVEAKSLKPPAISGAHILLPGEANADGLASLTYEGTPQRENFAASNMAENLLAKKATPSVNFTEISILVVEDNMINQTVLVRQLKKVGFIVSAANDGIEALAFLDQTHFLKEGGNALSIILMDLEMPKMDGLTCVREIRRMEYEGKIVKHVPVIAVTANVRDEQVEVAKSSGMDDVMSKPFRILELLVKIEAVLNDFQ